MLAFLSNLSLFEIVVIAVVAVLVFGGRLPEVAGQAAGVMARLRRQLADLRRETGIDREFYDVRRSVEQSIPRVPRSIDVTREIRSAVAEVTKPVATEALPPPRPPADAPIESPPKESAPPT